MTTSAILLIPNDITPAMITAGTTIAEVDATRGEIAWSAAAVNVGDQRVYQGWIYEAVRSSTNKIPPAHADDWRRLQPSNRMAPFDDQINTQAIASGELTYVLQPGFFSAIDLYALRGDYVEITLYDSPGGNVVRHEHAELYVQALGLYEYLFMPLASTNRYKLGDLPLLPGAELHITVGAAGGAEVRIGMIVVGFWESLIGASTHGGVEYNATAEIKTYSYIKTNDDGTTTIVPRNSATNVRASVILGAEHANAAAELLHRVAWRPVSFIASNLGRYNYISTFGLVSGGVSAHSWQLAKIDLNVKGYI